MTITVANFVSVKLQDNHGINNYNSWREQILCLVDSQDLRRSYLVDNRPNPIPDAWRRTDRLLKGWILGALSDELLARVVHLENTRDVWIYLEERFVARQNPPEPQPYNEPIAGIDQSSGLDTYIADRLQICKLA